MTRQLFCNNLKHNRIWWHLNIILLKSFIEELKLKNSIRSLKGKPHHNWILNLPTLALQWTGVFSLNSDSRVANVRMSVSQSICHKNLYDLRYQPSWLSVIPPISRVSTGVLNFRASLYRDQFQYFGPYWYLNFWKSPYFPIIH